MPFESVSRLGQHYAATPEAIIASQGGIGTASDTSMAIAFGFCHDGVSHIVGCAVGGFRAAVSVCSKRIPQLRTLWIFVSSREMRSRNGTGLVRSSNVSLGGSAKSSRSNLSCGNGSRSRQASTFSRILSGLRNRSRCDNSLVCTRYVAPQAAVSRSDFGPSSDGNGVGIRRCLKGYCDEGGP
jgi:hypothetical protein